MCGPLRLHSMEVLTPVLTSLPRPAVPHPAPTGWLCEEWWHLQLPSHPTPCFLPPSLHPRISSPASEALLAHTIRACLTQCAATGLALKVMVPLLFIKIFATLASLGLGFNGGPIPGQGHAPSMGLQWLRVILGVGLELRLG